MSPEAWRCWRPASAMSDRVIAYLDHIGRVEAGSPHHRQRFAMTCATARKRQARRPAHLVANRDILNLPKTAATTVSCRATRRAADARGRSKMTRRIIDLSLSARTPPEPPAAEIAGHARKVSWVGETRRRSRSSSFTSRSRRSKTEPRGKAPSPETSFSDVKGGIHLPDAA
jgi:hypothetical protein